MPGGKIIQDLPSAVVTNPYVKGARPRREIEDMPREPRRNVNLLQEAEKTHNGA
jgi:hypothetical protein